MNRMSAVFFLMSVLLCPSILLADSSSVESRGESLFRTHCSTCHPDGGNILNPSKTLFRKDREANNIFTVDDIVGKMRNPGAFSSHPNKWSGMKIFDERSITDTDAREIADFILTTFN